MTRFMLFDRSGAPLGDLDPTSVLSRNVVRELNGENTLTLETSTILPVGTRVLWRDYDGEWRENVVTKPDELHDGGDHAIGTYTLPYSLYSDLADADGSELWASAEAGALDPIPAVTALGIALSDQSMWQADTSTADGHTDVGTEGACSLFDAQVWDYLCEVVGEFGGDVQPVIEVGPSGVTSRKVRLRRHLGREDAVRRFDWARDLTSIRRTPEEGPYFCGVRPRGGASKTDNDGVDYTERVGIEDEPADADLDAGWYHDANSPYLCDSEAMLAFRRTDGNGGWYYPMRVVIYDVAETSSGYDAEELMLKAIDEVHDYTHPKVRYEADVRAFEQAGMDARMCSLGDEVTCVDRGFNPDAALRVQGRVTRLEYDPDDPWSTMQVTVGDLGHTAADAIRGLSVGTLARIERRVAVVEADAAKFSVLDADLIIADMAKLDNITAEQIVADRAKLGRIDANQLDADHAVISTLDANYAHITNGTIDNAKISYADVDQLSTYYAVVDLANVNNAWIVNGVVRDASIADAKIIGMSANKLTAGTINAGNIRVINLDAANITVGTLNGERIGNGSLSLEKLSERVYTEDEIDEIIGALNARIDSAIQTFTGDAVPLLNNYPASDWTTDALRAEHVGDVYYVVNASSQANGYCYRFVYDRTTSTYSWALIQDSAVTDAIQRLIDVEGDITGLKSFQSDTESWIETTDGSITSVIANHTALEAVVGDTLVGSVQLWRTTAVQTAPALPSVPVVGVGAEIVDHNGYVLVTDTGKRIVTDGDSNEWTVAVPPYEDSRPHYWYCWQYEHADGTYDWSEPVYDRILTEAQSTVRSTSAALEEYISATDDVLASLREQVDGQVDIWYVTADPTASTTPASGWDADERDLHLGDLCYNTTTGHAFRWVKDGSTYSWELMPDSDAATALAAAQDALATADGKRRVFTTTPTVPYDIGDLWVTGSVVLYASVARATGSYVEADWRPTATDDTMASGNVKSTVQLWYNKENGTAPAKPVAHVTTSDASTHGGWNRVVPTWNAGYPYYFYCFEYERGDGSYAWGDVVYDRATTESQRNAVSALEQVSTKVETTVFNEVKQTVDENSATITTLQSTVTTKADQSTVTTLTNTVNSVRQTADSNTASISQLSQTVSANETDIESKYSTVSQNLDGVTSRVGSLESVTGNHGSRLSQAESAIEQHAGAIALTATKTEVEGVAAEASAAHDLAEDAMDATMALRYTHTYERVGDGYVFTATLWQGTVDITADVDPQRFVWYLRNEDGETLWARGVTMAISGEQAGYRGSIIGGYEDEGAIMDAALVDHNGFAFVTDGGVALKAQVIWE